jgi:hypothetical protein
MIEDATHADGLVISARLTEFLEQSSIDERQRQGALKLLRRVSAPVRVTIFGRPGSGKSQMLNLLLGRSLIPDGLHPPTMSLQYGKEWRLRLTLPNGQMEEFNDFDLVAACKKNPVFLDMEAPIEALKTLALTELIAKGGEPEQKAAVAWAVRRTDICLWCTTDFNKQDAALWENVPEHIKDNAYLILTKAELWAQKGELEERMARMAPIAAEEFHSFFPVAALQGIAACEGGLLSDEAQWKASGGEALVNALYDHAARGRLEDFDAAVAFLDRHQAQRAQTLFVAEEPVRQAVGAVDSASCIKQARDLLTTNGRDLADVTLRFGKDTAPEILSQCLNVAHELSDILSPLEGSAANVLSEDAAQITEMITLLLLEGGATPAADAVCLLSQMNEELARAEAA